MKLPNRIAELRRAAGLSQTQLAERIGATLSMVGKLERGERDLNEHWLIKISEALNCPAARLIGDDPVFREFGQVGAGGAIFEWSSANLSSQFQGLFGLSRRIDGTKEVDGEIVNVQKLRTVTASAPLSLPLPQGSRFLFSWADATKTPNPGDLCVIGFWLEEEYRVILGFPYPGSTEETHHVLPLGGTMITDIVIEAAARISSVLLH